MVRKEWVEEQWKESEEKCVVYDRLGANPLFKVLAGAKLRPTRNVDGEQLSSSI